MTDKTYVCLVTQADEIDGEVEIRSRALFRIAAYDPEEAAQRAAEAWDDDGQGDKSDTLDDPLFVEVQEAETSEPPQRFRVASVIRRDYTTTDADPADPWPAPMAAEVGGAA